MKTAVTGAQKEAVLGLNVTIGITPALAPGLLKLVEAAGANPVKLNALVEKALARIKDALPPVVQSDTAQADPFTVAELSEKYQFATFETALGTGYRFTQPRGVTLLSIATEINKTSQELVGGNTIYPGLLLQDPGMRTGPQQDIVHECVPLIEGSNNLTKSEQESFLRGQGIPTIDRPVLTILTGLDRLNVKMQADDLASFIENDIFKAGVIRTRGGALASYFNGVDTSNLDIDCAYNHVFMAGAPRKELKHWY